MASSATADLFRCSPPLLLLSPWQLLLLSSAASDLCRCCLQVLRLALSGLISASGEALGGLVHSDTFFESDGCAEPIVLTAGVARLRSWAAAGAEEASAQRAAHRLKARLARIAPRP